MPQDEVSIAVSAQELRRALPRGACAILERIQAHGGQAFLVGGCLRDLLLGRPAKDFDIATDLLPERVKALFGRVHEVGAAFGTLMVPFGDGIYEVTTFRTEAQYRDGRHPDQVAYSQHLEEDLRRRDFTINAMAFDPRQERIEDPFDGLGDLKRQRIRAVGDPLERFREDALRLLRAVRFATELGFKIERQSMAALQQEAEGLQRISAERIRQELNRILLAETPSRGLKLLHHAGLLRIVLPELEACRGVAQNRFHAHDVFTHSVMATDAAPPDNLAVRLAALLHDVAKPETREEKGGDYTFYAHQMVGARKADRILRRLRYSNDEREKVTHLIRHHMFYYQPEWTDSAVRRFARAVGVENIPDLIALRLADMAGNTKKSGDTRPLQALLQRVEEVIAKDTALSVKDLAIGGKELAELGVAPGPAYGRILRALLEQVLDTPELNEPERLRAAARELIEEGSVLTAEPASPESAAASGAPWHSPAPPDSAAAGGRSPEAEA